MQLLQRAPDDAARAAAIDMLTAGIDRAARLVEQLLTLARSEPGVPAACVDGIDLSELVRGAVAQTVPFAHSRNTTLELFADAPVRLRGEPDALAVLARNLVDNAVRYSPHGARVELRVSNDGDMSTLQVDDAGPGIAPEDRERVFDRFYRHAAGSESGSGLGLAIVRSVAARHGASVELGDSALGGLRVSVRFPKPGAANSLSSPLPPSAPAVPA